MEVHGEVAFTVTNFYERFASARSLPLMAPMLRRCPGQELFPQKQPQIHGVSTMASMFEGSGGRLSLGSANGAVPVTPRASRL